MTKSELKRQQLYNKFSEQLILLQKNGIVDMKFDSEKPYLCPICLRAFTTNDLDINRANFLTLEDAPPDALGGKKVALTCKQCNNVCGTSIDHQFISKIYVS
jgi:hypothetical protein